MDLTTSIGVLGAFILLVVFFLNQINKLTTENIYYDTFNAIGSTLLVIYAILLDSIPFLVLNGVWAIVSIRDMIVYKKKS